MAQSREEFLNSIAQLGLKQNNHKSLPIALVEEIRERISSESALDARVTALENDEDHDNSDLLTRIISLEQEVTRLQTELSLHENNGMHWTGEAIDQRAQALIDASSSN
jgi:hypothetical protein